MAGFSPVLPLAWGLPHRSAERLLAGLTVIVDGSGPGIPDITDSLRSVGIGRVRSGPYAAEAAIWALGDDEFPDAWGEEDAGMPPAAAVVFVRRTPLPWVMAAPWARDGVTHLQVHLDGHRAQIGPLVIPGVSSCIRCHDLTRRTAAGPRGIPPGTSGRAPDRATTLLAAALTAVTLRGALLGDHGLAGVSSEIETGRPEVRHRHWPRHVACPCAAETVPRWAVAHWTMGA
ncbi:MAG TPA: hypothetical protein PLX71_11200 [Phycicoccus sp.]|nr:hypothetical protein [Phycicoccus sp.]